MMVRYRAIVEYDGTDFSGYQLQARRRTVQGELEKAITSVTRCEARVTGAGRTDAGVHATGQVIAFEVSWRHEARDLLRALNAVLAEDVAIKKLEVAEPRFHPRYDAIRRQYRYTVMTAATRSPMTRRYAHLERERLSVEAMQAGCRWLLGSHDFRAFGRPPQGDTTVRFVTQAEWRTEGEERLEFDIAANAFLYRMVRNIVGTLLRIGRGELPAEHVKGLIETGDRRGAGPAAPAQGLCLVKIDYANDSVWREEGVASS